MATHSFPANLPLLHEMLKFIATQATKKGFASADIDKIILATEEALVNVIKHGKCGEHCDIVITCEDTSPPGLRIIIKDCCLTFDPIAWAKKTYSSQDLKADALSLGGRGISLYISLMDHVEYQRQDGCNLLSLTKHLS